MSTLSSPAINADQRLSSAYGCYIPPTRQHYRLSWMAHVLSDLNDSLYSIPHRNAPPDTHANVINDG
eukprot:scaffold231279_cov20-Cyclotella_meneghiniana.AAC.1